MRKPVLESVAYLSHGLVAAGSARIAWVDITDTSGGEIATYILAFAVVAIWPVALILVAFITGFFFKPTRYLSLLMPVMIFGFVGSYDHRFLLLTLPYIFGTAAIVLFWAYEKAKSRRNRTADESPPK
jgi:hypothetical protein